MGFLKVLLLFSTIAFAQSTTSPNMGLPVSIIGTTSGLNWENNLNASLGIIDQHNHTAGQGVQIPPAGLNINSDLTFNSNNATNLRTTRFSPQVSPIANTGSDVGELYVSGNELYYNDVNGGNQVQITSSGTVNATSSGIASGTATAAFSAGTLLVKSSSTSFGNTAVQSILLANSGNLSNQLTLAAPVLSTSITETLPAIPGAQNFMAIDASGNMSAYAAVSGGITGSNIASTTVTRQNQVAVGQQTTGSLSGSYTASSFPSTIGSVTITTTGRPVIVSLVGDGLGGQASLTITAPSTSKPATILLGMSNGASQLQYYPLYLQTNTTTAAFGTIAPSFVWIDTPAAGSHTYLLSANQGTSSNATVLTWSNVQLLVYEL